MSTDAPTPMPQRPTSPDELAAAVRAAADAGSQVQVIGSNSLPLTCFDDARPRQAISTLRLRGIVHHDAGGMTVTVRAGTTLEALQQQLAWHNQWLPIDPPAGNGRTPGTRTLGGLVATNSLGPLRHGFGDWRALLLGARWVDAEGRLITGGGRSFAAAAGPHSPRTFIDSRGTLGALAELTLRTYVRPADERALVMFAPDAAAAAAIVAATLAAPLQPAYVQLVGGRAFAENPLQLPTAGQIIIVGFLAQPDVCAAQVETLRALPSVAAVDTIQQTVAQAGRLRLWMTTEPAGVFGFRATVPPAHTAALLAELETRAGSQDRCAWLVAEAGAGVVRGSVAAAEPPSPDADAALLGAVRESVTSCGGTLTVAIGGPHPHIAPAATTNRLKRQLDPRDVFGTP